jgi:hypothetical protein
MFMICTLFINDIVTDIEASIKLFADDTSLYVTVDTPPSAADIINRDLEQIHQTFQTILKDCQILHTVLV